MVACGRCGKENETSRETCARCGTVLEPGTESSTEPEEPAHFCYRHPKTATELSCGRCGKYLCPKCVKLGPAGPRCRDCSRSGVSLRPAGVAHEASVTARRWFSASPYLTLIVVFTLGSALLGLMRGCKARPSAPSMEQTDVYEPGD
ncbi:MAG: hypothetical protein AB7F50_01450 [Fimbriimonadaceae bacterium]